MGLLDYEVYVVLALRPVPDCSAQPQSISAVPDHQASLQCPTTNHQVSLLCPTARLPPCSAQPQSVPAAPNHQLSLQSPSIPAVSNRIVSLQCPNSKYPCSAQPQSIPAVPKRRTAEFSCAQQQSITAGLNHQVSRQCPWLHIPAVPKPTVFLQCSVAKSPCGAQHLQCRTPQMLTFADFAN